jgi:hypothetical protein
VEIISVLEVVESIAAKVPLPAEWSAGILNRDEVPASALLQKSGKVHFPASSYRLRMDFLNGLFLKAYRDSQAAGALDYCLDQTTEDVPQWYDWGPTGWPKASKSAREDGLSMLVHMSRYFERYMQAHQSGKFDGWPKRNEMKISEGKFSTETDAQRLSEIGFEKTEMVRFLKCHGIPSSLTVELPGLSAGHSASMSTELQSGANPEVASDIPLENEKNNSTAPDSTTHLINKVNKVGHVLADFIAAGQVQAGDHRKDPRVVYGILIELAESGAFLPRVKKFIPRRGIEYLNAAGNTRHYTYGALVKSLDPTKRGRKKKPAADIDVPQPTSVDP